MPSTIRFPTLPLEVFTEMFDSIFGLLALKPRHQPRNVEHTALGTVVNDGGIMVAELASAAATSKPPQPTLVRYGADRDNKREPNLRKMIGRAGITVPSSRYEYLETLSVLS
jgi:hypothetical protein